MKKPIILLVMIFLVTACGSEKTQLEIPVSPRILSVESNRNTVQLNEKIELKINLVGTFNNPFYSRDITLDSVFTGTDGSQWSMPGFWDAESTWIVRFTPSIVGSWDFKLVIKDRDGSGRSNRHYFSSLPSSNHAWLQIGNWGNQNSMVDGTNAYNQQDGWHERVNLYFTQNDPYRHRTTARMAGDRWWPNGFRVMDVLQLHSYATDDDPIETGPVIADWTQKLSVFSQKPNFKGEFGTPNQRNQPEHLHNALWAGLVSGAALTHMDWNGSGPWGSMTPEMLEQIPSFSYFLKDLKLGYLETTIREVSTSSNELQGRGIGRNDWASVWIQDISQRGQEISLVRKSVKTHSGEVKFIKRLAEGQFKIQPFNTWEGKYIPDYVATFSMGLLSIPLPEFEQDFVFMATIK